MQADAVIFDMDGTLTDSMPFLAAGVRDYAMALSGRRITTQEVIAGFGPPDIDVIAGLIGRPLTAQEIGGYLAHLRAELHESVPPIEGMPEMLDRAQAAGIRLGVYSARSLIAGWVVMAGMGLDKYFDVFIAGDTVAPHYKPEPHGLIAAMAALEAEASRTLYVGDTKHDLQVAEAVGVRSVLALWASDPRVHLVDEADLVGESVRQFVDWLIAD